MSCRVVSYRIVSYCLVWIGRYSLRCCASPCTCTYSCKYVIHVRLHASTRVGCVRRNVNTPQRNTYMQSMDVYRCLAYPSAKFAIKVSTQETLARQELILQDRATLNHKQLLEHVPVMWLFWIFLRISWAWGSQSEALCSQLAARFATSAAWLTGSSCVSVLLSQSHDRVSSLLGARHWRSGLPDTHRWSGRIDQEVPELVFQGGSDNLASRGESRGWPFWSAHAAGDLRYSGGRLGRPPQAEAGSAHAAPCGGWWRTPSDRVRSACCSRGPAVDTSA